MPSAGEILSEMFDERFMKKAQGYSQMYESWKDITEKNRIPAAADYSRIKELEKGILHIEVDHPGWKQILQTKQSKLLHDFRVRFPDLGISGLALILGKSEFKNNSDEPVQKTEINTDDTEKNVNEIKNNNGSVSKSIDTIKDEELKKSLRNLGQAIKDSSH